MKPAYRAATSMLGIWTRAPPCAPRRTVISDSDSRTRNASRSVGRDTLKRSSSSASEGRASPSFSSPRTICLRSWSAISSAILGSRMGCSPLIPTSIASATTSPFAHCRYRESHSPNWKISEESANYGTSACHMRDDYRAALPFGGTARPLLRPYPAERLPKTGRTVRLPDQAPSLGTRTSTVNRRAVAQGGPVAGEDLADPDDPVNGLFPRLGHREEVDVPAPRGEVGKERRGDLRGRTGRTVASEGLKRNPVEALHGLGQPRH